ncbi:MAG: M23 family metallopeptidase [Spirochaeta sp.]
MKQDSNDKKPEKKSLLKFLRAVFASSSRTFTVMIVPHSHKDAFHLRVNAFAVLLGFLLIGGIVASFLILATEYTTSDRLQVQQREAEQARQQELELVIDEIHQLQQTAQRFDSSMGQAVQRFGVNESEGDDLGPADGDLGDLFGLQEVQDDDFRSLYDIQHVRGIVEGAVEPIQRIYDAVSGQQELLEDIPHLWPVQGGQGTVVATFGPGFHPVFDTWYVNRGMHIATASYGDQIVAAANGAVASIEFDPADRGWYVRIEHRYGFSTLYAHLNSISVSEGERVSQGQIIGEIGDSGYVNSPRLGFEIMLGSDVLDPETFIQSADSSSRWTGSRRSGT